VSSVRRVLHLAGVPDVTGHHSVQLVLRGAKRLLGSRQRQKLPLQPRHLLLLRQHLQLPSPQGLALWCGILTCWWGFLRRSNVAGPHALKRADVSLRANSVRVAVSSSKTRQFGDRRHQVFLPRLRAGGSRAGLLCPWTAMAAHLRVNCSGTGEAEQLLAVATPSGRVPLSAASFDRRLSDCLLRAGLPVGDFSSHSLRRGGATFASESGVSLVAIRQVGDWRSDSVRR
jgi:integrase